MPALISGPLKLAPESGGERVPRDDDVVPSPPFPSIKVFGAPLTPTLFARRLERSIKKFGLCPPAKLCALPAYVRVLYSVRARKLYPRVWRTKGCFLLLLRISFGGRLKRQTLPEILLFVGRPPYHHSTDVELCTHTNCVGRCTSDAAWESAFWRRAKGVRERAQKVLINAEKWAPKRNL